MTDPSTVLEVGLRNLPIVDLNIVTVSSMGKISPLVTSSVVIDF